MRMALWWISLFLGLYSFFKLWRVFAPALSALFGGKQETRNWRECALRLRHLEGKLEAGQWWIPEEYQYFTHAPTQTPSFVQRAFGKVLEQRARGVSILPLLKRVRVFCDQSADLLTRANEETAGARAQASACLLLFPLFGVTLSFVLPDLRAQLGSWSALCLFSFFLGAFGFVWMLQMSRKAQWGTLSHSQRGWLFLPMQIGVQLVCELQNGVPPDLAWTSVYRDLQYSDHAFSLRMSPSLWVEPSKRESPTAMLRLLDRAVEDQKRLLAHALLEGRSSVESLERLLSGVQTEINAEISRHVRRLGTRALLPLFLCVAPGFFVLVCGALLLGSGLFTGEPA